MNNKSFLVIAFSVLLIFGCSGARYSVSKKSLKENYVSGKSGLRIKIPNGWFQAFDAGENDSDIWLVSDDYSSSIKFTLITFDSKGNNLHNAVEISKATNKVLYGDPVGFKNKETGNKNTLAYEILKNGKLFSYVIVFNINGKFYECKSEFADDLTEEKRGKVISIQKLLTDNLFNL